MVEGKLFSGRGVNGERSAERHRRGSKGSISKFVTSSIFWTSCFLWHCVFEYLYANELGTEIGQVCAPQIYTNLFIFKAVG